MIAIIDYHAGNLTSVARAVAHLGVDHEVTNDLGVIARAERIIFPGVGAAGSAMKSLVALGLDQAIKAAFADKKPILGICLGTQIITAFSEENHTHCLGLIQGKVSAFPQAMTGPDGRKLKIPHMGWNRVHMTREHPVFSGIHPEDEFYFVHGYFPMADQSEDVIGITEYGVSFSSIIGRDNLVATQFHPEKSGPPGLRILENFSRWQPC